MTAVSGVGCCLCSTRSCLSVAASDARAASLTRCSRTAAMTMTSHVIRSEFVASSRRSPGEEHGTVLAWAPTAGWAKDVCLVARPPVPACPLGAQGRHARSLPRTRLLPHHPPAAQDVVLTFDAGLLGAPWMSAASAMIRPHE